MTTQYTTILKLALPVQGELSGTWGDVVNNNITQMVEQAVAGKAVVNTWTGNSHTLTTADGTTSESRCAILELTDSGTALTGAGTVVCPTNTKLYIVDNNTAQIITVKTSGGTGVAVPVGKTMLVYCDGTNVVEGVTHANSLSLGTSTVTADKILDEDNMASDSATAIATQQSIKAYVDSQVGSFDTLAEVLAQGNTTGGTDIAVGTGDDITFADSSKAIFGDGSDLQIYHNANNSYIQDVGTGKLHITSDGTGVSIDKGVSEVMATFDTDGAVTLYHNALVKLATTATGIDVTGSVTADGFQDTQSTSGFGYLNFGDTDDANIGQIGYDHSSNYMRFQVNNAERMRIESDGNVRINESLDNITGTLTLNGRNTGNIIFQSGGAEKMRIASSGSVGIGASSPNYKLNVLADAGAQNIFQAGQSGVSNGLSITSNGSALTYSFLTGSVGIGTSSPALAGGGTGLHINATSYPELKFTNSTTGAGAGDGSLLQSSGNNFTIQNREAGSISFSTSNTLRATLDASGNLLVGKTAVSLGAVGVEVKPFGEVRATASEAQALQLNRLSSDGIIVDFRKDSAPVGSIGVAAGAKMSVIGTNENLQIGANGVNVFNVSTTSVYPATDNATDLGFNSSTRWKDLYLSGTATTGSNIHLQDSGTTRGKIELNASDADDLDIKAVSLGSNMKFFTVDTERMRIDASGKVGIGTSSPDTPLHISTNVQAVAQLESAHANGSYAIWAVGGTKFGDVGSNKGISGSGNTTDFMIASRSTYPLILGTGSTERMRIDANGNVGIGASSPATRLHVSGADNVSSSLTLTNTAPAPDNTWTFVPQYNALDLAVLNNGTERMRIDSSGTLLKRANGNIEVGGYNGGTDYGLILTPADGSTWWHIYNDAGGHLAFGHSNTVGSTERMRLDASGNLLVGKTAANSGTVGIEARPTGRLFATADGAYAAKFERLSSDGTLIQLTQDAAPVGAIGVKDGDLVIHSTAAGHEGLRLGNGAIVATDNAGTTTDAACNLGGATSRFTNLYLSGGVYLGGTGAANLLDDYEEGTWTPTLVGTTSGSATLTVSKANYTKVGNKVFAACYLSGIDLSTDTIVGTMKIDGLPFTGASEYSQAASITFQNISTTYLNISAYVQTSWLLLNQNSTTTTLTRADCVSTSSRSIMVGVTYTTTA